MVSFPAKIFGKGFATKQGLKIRLKDEANSPLGLKWKDNPPKDQEAAWGALTGETWGDKDEATRIALNLAKKGAAR